MVAPLRILLVSEDLPHPHIGGLGKHVVTLGNALLDAGHRVDLMGNVHYPWAERDGDVGFRGNFIAALDGAGANWKEHKLGFFIYQRHAYLARRYARAILRVASAYDVVHYHGHLPNLANCLPGSMNFVQTRHDQGSDCLRFTRFRDDDVCRAIEPRACAICAAAQPNAMQALLSAASVQRWRDAVRHAFERHKVIFVSRFLHDNLARSLGPLDACRAGVVHNFIDLATLHAATAGPAAQDDPPDIFIAARIDAAKGVGPFLAEFARQRPVGRHVTVAGDGPALAELRQCHASENVRFLGWQSYARTVVLSSRCNAAVVPSICEEPCGTTILEALALGRPVFALRRGGTPELAAYQRFPGQLRLCADMAELVAAVLASAPAQSLDGPAECAADVHALLPRIEAIYREARCPTASLC